MFDDDSFAKNSFSITSFLFGESIVEPPVTDLIYPPRVVEPFIFIPSKPDEEEEAFLLAVLL